MNGAYGICFGIIGAVGMSILLIFVNRLFCNRLYVYRSQKQTNAIIRKYWIETNKSHKYVSFAFIGKNKLDHCFIIQQPRQRIRNPMLCHDIQNTRFMKI